MNEDQRKHLEFIQNVITRMNSNSFVIKGWAVTLVAALYAFAAKDANLDCVLITYLAIPIFWGLDAFYLSQEKKYRELYKHAINPAVNIAVYDMNAARYRKFRLSWLYCLFTKTILPIYLMMVIVTTLIVYSVNGTLEYLCF